MIKLRIKHDLKKICITGFWLLMSAQLIHAYNITQVSTLVGGDTETVAIQGNYAYAGLDNFLYTLDITDPTKPMILSIVDTTSNVRDIKLQGTTAVIANGFFGLSIYDLSNPAQPVLTGNVDTTGGAKQVALAGNYAYLADYSSGLGIFDISNPASPTEISYYTLTSTAEDIAISGDYAYIAYNYNGLRVVNINNPAAPQEVADYAQECESISINGNYAFLSSYWDGLVILDINNPAAPSSLGSYNPIGGLYEAAISGNYAYLCTTSDFYIIDISMPNSPSQVNALDYEGNHVTIAGQYAYLTDDIYGMTIFNINVPSAPVQVGAFSDNDDVNEIAKKDNYLYVVDDYSDLRIIDVTDPTVPVRKGQFFSPGRAKSITIIGDYAYLSDDELSDSNFLVLDITTPATPTQIGAYTYAGGWADTIAINGSYAYLAAAKLRILDISNLAAPQEISNYDTPGSVNDIVINGNYAYIADSYSGLGIYDITNPALPAEVGYYDTEDAANVVAIDGQYVYLVEEHVLDKSELHVIDITQPSAPQQVAALKLRGLYGDAHDIKIDNHHAFVADGSEGLQMIDISDPFAPRIVDWARIDSAVHVVVDGQYLYVGNEYEGLEIHQVIPPTPTPTSTPIVTPTPTSEPIDATLKITGKLIKPHQGQKSQIQYGVATSGQVIIKVYNLHGREVKTLVDTQQPSGNYSVEWAAKNAADAIVASGIYMIHIKTPTYSRTQKIVVVK